MKCYTYLRLSSEGQRSALSVAQQKKAIIRFIRKNGLKVVTATMIPDRQKRLKW